MSSHDNAVQAEAPVPCTVLLSMLFLALPNVIFLAGWMEPWVAVSGLLGLALALRPVLFRSGFRGEQSSLSPALQLTLLGVACAWSMFGGAGHFFHANLDWVVRDAVLRDLVAFDWPIGYRSAAGDEYLLRSALGYYLPAAVFGKLAGRQLADMALLAWTALGVWLLLCTVVDRADSPFRVAGKVAAVVLFSGLDVVGAQFTGFGLSATGHMEWWARLFQYSSNTTLLFWVPGHALPGWLAAAILYRYRDRPWTIRILPGLLALLPLWSPLAAVGVLPLAAAAGLAGLRRPGSWRQVNLTACVGSCVLVGLLSTYITADSGGIRAGLGLAAAPDPATARTVYLTFVFLEIALIFALVLAFNRSLLVLTAGLVLFLLPLYRFGPANDFVMRASIPSLMIMALALADTLQVAFSDPRLRAFGWIGGFLLLLGAATPMTEFARAVSLPRWAPDAEKTVFDVTRGDHYLVRIRDTAAERVLKPVRYQAVR